MSAMKTCSPLGWAGVIGGVILALGLPWIVLVYGDVLSPAMRNTVIILALVGGGVLAIASVVIGITIPTALQKGRLDIAACCVPLEHEEDSDAKDA